MSSVYLYLYTGNAYKFVLCFSGFHFCIQIIASIPCFSICIQVLHTRRCYLQRPHDKKISQLLYLCKYISTLFHVCNKFSPIFLCNLYTVLTNLSAYKLSRPYLDLKSPGGAACVAQYFENGKITKWDLRTSKPSAIAEFLDENSALQRVLRKIALTGSKVPFWIYHVLYVWLRMSPLRGFFLNCSAYRPSEDLSESLPHRQR